MAQRQHGRPPSALNKVTQLRIRDREYTKLFLRHTTRHCGPARFDQLKLSKYLQILRKSIKVCQKWLPITKQAHHPKEKLQCRQGKHSLNNSYDECLIKDRPFDHVGLGNGSERALVGVVLGNTVYISTLRRLLIGYNRSANCLSWRRAPAGCKAPARRDSFALRY